MCYHLTHKQTLKHTLICVYTHAHIHKKCRSLLKLALDWALSNPPPLSHPQTPNSNMQMNGAWIKVFCRWPLISLSAVYAPSKMCIFQVTHRLWVSLQQWADRQSFQPSFSSSNFCFTLFGMNLTAASGCTIAAPTDPSGLWPPRQQQLSDSFTDLR